VPTRPQEVREYLTPNGANPFRDWFHSLKDGRTRARVRVRINRVRMGIFGDSKPVGGGVHELRLAFGPGYRIYFGRDGQTLVLLLCAGDKRSQGRDIQRAKSFWQDYRRSENYEESIRFI
jgi:putative addiction module killer protein